MCLDISPWNLSGGYFQVPLGRSRKLVSGLFHLPINGIYWSYTPLILTIDPNFQRDILPHAAVWLGLRGGPMSSHGWSPKRWNVSGGRYTATRTSAFEQLLGRKEMPRFCYAQLLRNIPIGIKACNGFYFVGMNLCSLVQVARCVWYDFFFLLFLYCVAKLYAHLYGSFQSESSCSCAQQK